MSNLVMPPRVRFEVSDRGGEYLAKLRALAAAVDASMDGYNAMIEARNDAVGIMEDITALAQQALTDIEGVRSGGTGDLVAGRDSALAQMAEAHTAAVDQLHELLESAGMQVGPLGGAAKLDVGTTAGTVAAGDDERLSDAREWLAAIVSQAEAEGGTSKTARKWTAERVRQAIEVVLADADFGSGPRPVKDHGPVATAGSQTVVCNLQEADFHMLDMSGANAAGALTIDFANMPDTTGKYFSWHVRLQRGGRKSVVFAQEIEWTGGTQPPFGGSNNSIDLLMFYRVGNEPIRGMAVDAR